jgi:excisionase family DNA binding protein
MITYTIPELVPILRIKKRAIRKLVSNGNLSGRLVGRQILVTEEALKRFLKAPDTKLCGNCLLYK